MVETYSLRFEYTNHEGRKAWRNVKPLRVEFSTNPHLRQPEWLLIGYDLDKGAERAFVLKHISQFEDCVERKVF